jgi:hypothetical protein
MKAGFVTGKDLNLFNRCFKLGVGDQLVYYQDIFLRKSPELLPGEAQIPA